MAESVKRQYGATEHDQDEHDSSNSLPTIKRRLVRPKQLRRVDDRLQDDREDRTSTPGAGPSSPHSNAQSRSRSRSASPQHVGSRSPPQQQSIHSPSRARAPSQATHPHRLSLPSGPRSLPPPPTCPYAPPRSAHPTLNPCRSVYNYTRLNHIEEGTYGVVFRARCNDTGGIYALKKLKLEEERHGFPITSLREVMALQVGGQHEHVVGIKEIVVGDTLNQYVLSQRSLPVMDERSIVLIMQDLHRHAVHRTRSQNPSGRYASSLSSIRSENHHAAAPLCRGSLSCKLDREQPLHAMPTLAAMTRLTLSSTAT